MIRVKVKLYGVLSDTSKSITETEVELNEGSIKELLTKLDEQFKENLLLKFNNKEILIFVDHREVSNLNDKLQDKSIVYITLPAAGG